MHIRSFALAGALLVLGFTMTGCTATMPDSAPTTDTSSVMMQESQTSTTTDGITTQESQGLIELTAGEVDEGTTAMALLQKSGARVVATDYGEMGSFITAINDVAGTTENYWSFYVNDVYATQAADKTVLKAGDRVKFVFERVSAAPAM